MEHSWTLLGQRRCVECISGLTTIWGMSGWAAQRKGVQYWSDIFLRYTTLSVWPLCAYNVSGYQKTLRQSICSGKPPGLCVPNRISWDPGFGNWRCRLWGGVCLQWPHPLRTHQSVQHLDRNPGLWRSVCDHAGDHLVSANYSMQHLSNDSPGRTVKIPLPDLPYSRWPPVGSIWGGVTKMNTSRGATAPYECKFCPIEERGEKNSSSPVYP